MLFKLSSGQTNQQTNTQTNKQTYTNATGNITSPTLSTEVISDSFAEHEWSRETWNWLSLISIWLNIWYKMLPNSMISGTTWFVRPHIKCDWMRRPIARVWVKSGVLLQLRDDSQLTCFSWDLWANLMPKRRRPWRGALLQLESFEPLPDGSVHKTEI